MVEKNTLKQQTKEITFTETQSEDEAEIRKGEPVFVSGYSQNLVTSTVFFCDRTT